MGKTIAIKRIKVKKAAKQTGKITARIKTIRGLVI